MSNDKQIFGKEASTESELIFIKPHEEYKAKKNVDSGMNFEFSRVHFNEQKESITIFGSNDRDGQAIGVFLNHHPEAKFKDSKPDGVRFLGALARHHSIIGTADEIVDHHNTTLEDITILNVLKTPKGVLWTVKEAI